VPVLLALENPVSSCSSIPMMASICKRVTRQHPASSRTSNTHERAAHCSLPCCPYDEMVPYCSCSHAGPDCLLQHC
jgi:hypothetical protein